MQYPFKVSKCKGRGSVFWVAESITLKGCIGVGGTVYRAIESLEDNENIWIETAVQNEIEVPEIPIEQF